MKAGMSSNPLPHFCHFLATFGKTLPLSEDMMTLGI